MTLDYQKVWNTMNELEMVTSKICSAREILDSAADRLQEHQYDKAETLMYAADEYLQYYLEEFDRKFKDAWKETVTQLKEQEIDDCMPPRGHSDMEAMKYTDEELESMCTAAEKEQAKPKSWCITVEEAYNKDGETIFSYIQLPDDLIERMGLTESSHLRWIDNKDGTVTIKKA